MDKHFLDYITQFDVIILQETWMTSDFIIPNYMHILTLAFPGQKSGRASGGVGIFISCSLKVSINELNSTHKWAVADDFP